MERVARILCQAQGNLGMMPGKNNWSWCHVWKTQTVLKAREIFFWCQENKVASLFLYWFRFRILSFSVGREAIWLSVKLKIDLFRCRKKKIFHPKKIFTFSEVTKRNFSWRNPRVVLKLIPCFGLSIFLILYIRDELIFLRIKYFVLPWIYTCSQRGGLGN